MKRHHITIFLLILVIIVALFYFLKPAKTIAPGNVSQTATSSSGEVLFTYTTKTINEQNTDKHYSIKADYPVFSLKNADAEKNLNDSVAILVQDEVNSSRSNFDGVNNPNGSYGDSTFTLGFNIDNNKTLRSIIPIRFSESSYTAGAAHPGDDILTANYNLATGDPISLVSLFRPGSNYLETLSTLSINALKAKMGDSTSADQIQAGAGPKEENFQNFLITDNGLVVIFNEYQVSSYGAGEQEVTIPWSSLQTILNPTGPLRSKINS